MVMSPNPLFPRNKLTALLVSASVASTLSLVAPVAWGANDLAVKTLTEQARFWESKGRSDLAIAAWRRLLQVDPKNGAALTALAQLEVDNNRPDAAKALLDQLKTQPDAPKEAIRRVENSVALKSVNSKLLEQARSAAKAGRADEAVALYKQLFDGQPVPAGLGLEYYQTLGSLSTGWDEARKGLEGLAASDPSNSKANLAYAQHLTYRAATRREGIRLLSQLASDGQVGSVAVESWRKALIWLEASKSDISLFQAFLGVQPNDAAIQARIAGLNQAYAPKPLDPRTLALRNGFNALNSGDVDEAERRFQALNANGPRNPDVLGGLGVVRLKQERFADAEKLLSEAVRLSGSAKWNEALTAARFWLALEVGDREAASGNIAAARRYYETAARLDPKQLRPVSALADLLVEEGRLLDAEGAYRQALASHPKSVDLRRGLAGVLVRQGKVDEALVLAQGLSDAERDELGYGSLKAEQYRLKAVQMMAAGNAIGAMQQLEEALLWDPNSPWLRLELARLYHKSGATNEAFGLMDGLLQTRPDMPDALHAAALMSAEAKEWAMALSMLERIPPKSRTKDMADLQRRLWVNAQVGNAQALLNAGQAPRAAQVLDQAQQAAGTDRELLAVVAQGMVELGDDNRSLQIMRALLAQSPRPETGLLVQYAGMLLKTRQDVELATQLRQLYTLKLTPEQRTDLDAIRWAYSLRQVDAQREAGNTSAGYEIAAQLLSERPNDTQAQQALARLYSSAGEHNLALAWYHQLLQQGKPDVATLVAASGSAIAVGELAYAQSAIDTASRMAPSDPSVLSAMGRLARAQGKNKLAVELLQQAQQVSLARAQTAQAGPLGVQLVDYTLPPPAGTPNRQVGSAVPLIPNPLGARPVAPSPQPRPLMQQVPSYPYSPATLAPQPAPRGVPLSQAPAGADTWTNDSPLRPVQYQLPRRTPSVFDAPVAASPVPTAYPGPVLNTVSTQPSPATYGPAYPPAYPAYAETPPATTYPAYPVASTYPGYPAATVRTELGAASTPTFTNVAQAPAVAPSPLPAEPLVPSGWSTPTRITPGGRGASAPGSLQREIDELRAGRAGQVSGGGLWRGRSGDAGTSELTDFTVTAQGRFPVGESGHLVLRLEPVFLSAGRVSSTDFNASQQFGTNAFANVGGAAGTIREQQDSGMALSVGYETAKLKLDVGVTPLGFAVQNLVGGVAYNDDIGGLKVKADFSRRAVTDSLLSYAGTRDDRTGTTWGGVTATGGRIEVGTEEGPFGLYGYGGLHVLTGKNVVSNNRFEIGGGAYYKFIQGSDLELTAGVNVTTLGYKRNLRYFTLGHGGYFSPQRYFSLSFPVEVAGRTGKMSYRLDASVGLQSFKENSVAYFPGNSTLQGDWESVAVANAIAAPVGVTWRTFYPGQSKTGLGFRIGGEAEYRFAPQWTVGGKVSVDNASNYTQTSGLLYVRYHFDPIHTPVQFPPQPLKVGP